LSAGVRFTLVGATDAASTRDTLEMSVPGGNVPA